MNAASQVTLPDDLLTKAEERAQVLGLSVTEYVQALVLDDVSHRRDPWREPLPWAVEKQYLLDEIEFYDTEKNAPQVGANSAEELLKLLDEEIQQVDADETN